MQLVKLTLSILLCALVLLNILFESFWLFFTYTNCTMAFFLFSIRWKIEKIYVLYDLKNQVFNIYKYRTCNRNLRVHTLLIIIHVDFSQKSQNQEPNITFLMDWVQMTDLDFGLMHQNISIKKASFHYQGCPLSLKSGKLWLNSYVYWISITTNWFYSQQFSLPYSKNILSVCPFRGDKKNKKKSYILIQQNFSIKEIYLFSPFLVRKNIHSCIVV